MSLATLYSVKPDVFVNFQMFPLQQEEISGLTSEARPGLAQTALALTRIFYNPRTVNQQPAAAKVLATLLDKLRSASARGRRGHLTVVRTMTEKGGASRAVRACLTAFGAAPTARS
jgi:hypothetical protein